jgi:uncharacterized membrane protein (TIGR02234 family)
VPPQADPPQTVPPQADPPQADAGRGRREFTVTLLAGAAGAALVLLALRQVWAHALYTPPHPLPRQDFAVSGQQLVPLASALAIAALACLAAVIATRGLLRRAAGLLLAVIGAGAAVTATAAVTASAVLSAVANANPAAGAGSGTGAGSTTSGTPGSGASAVIEAASGHAYMTGWPWHVTAAAGALVVVLAGLATAWRGTRWPVMSARFDRPGQQSRPAQADSATMWESLSRDQDPTVSSDDGPARRA